MNRILVVDDESSITDMVRMFLSKNGYSCDTASDGGEAAELIEQKRYDLVLLDIMLPVIDGYDLIEYIKQYNTPVIFITAKASVENRVRGLRLGAEDYIVKPFDLEELLARIETVLRRYNKVSSVLTAGKISVDIKTRIVTLRGEEVFLSAKEFDLLLYLIRNKNIALWRERIYEEVWKEPYYGGTRTVDLHIGRLRKKLDMGDAIENIYKVGYKFLPEKLK